jgi:hypothetical protein
LLEILSAELSDAVQRIALRRKVMNQRMLRAEGRTAPFQRVELEDAISKIFVSLLLFCSKRLTAYSGTELAWT